MNNYVCVGKVLKPQALKGELKVAVSMRNIQDFASYKYIYLGSEHLKYLVEKCRVQDGFVIVKLVDINDADSAETMRNKEVFIDRSQLASLAEDEYFVQDLVGLDVFTDAGAEALGQVVGVDNFSSTDIITIKKDGKEILFPFLASVVKAVDFEHKKMIVDEQKFEEVRVDED